MTHNELDANVLALAVELGIGAYHFPNSIGVSQRGWPDWVLVGKRGVLYRENKIPPDRCTSEQRKLGYLLQMNGCDWAVWTPDAWESGVIGKEMRTIA